METKKELGEIAKASFGVGGYQDEMIGLDVILQGTGGKWTAGDFMGTWKFASLNKANEDRRITHLGGMVKDIAKILNDAGKQHVHELVGSPIEATFSARGALVHWRILTEVIK